MLPAELRRVIRDAGRVPVQRDTLYHPVRTYPGVKSGVEEDLLDAVEDADDRFGSYEKLTRDERFRFKRSLPLA
jgi:FO synthase subunit 2